MRVTLISSALAVLLLAGCSVGPDFKPVEVDPPTAWLTSPDGEKVPATTTSEQAQKLAVWWNTLNDPVLSKLIESAFADNLDVLRAGERLRQARASRQIAAAPFFPTLGANLQYSNSDSGSGRNVVTTTTPVTGTATNITTGSTTVPGTVSTVSSNNELYKAGFDATWEIDIFGGTRRAVEAADAQVEFAELDISDVSTSLAAEIATQYITLRGSQQRMLVATNNLGRQERIVSITQKRFNAGFANSIDATTAEAQLVQTKTVIPQLDQQIQIQMYTLGVLLGKNPGALISDLAPVAGIPVSNGSILAGIPSELLSRRPDVRKAEAQLHAAVANLGVAEAEQYPKLSLSASLFLTGGALRDLDNWSDKLWSFASGLQLPIFQGGAIQGNISVQKAAVADAVLAYRAAVLVAFRDVEVALVSYDREAQRRGDLERSVQLNQKALDTTTNLYREGLTEYLNVITAEQSLFSAEDSLAQSRQTLALNLVSVNKALGGGWQSNARLPLAN